jgi:hypothetical protein
MIQLMVVRRLSVAQLTPKADRTSFDMFSGRPDPSWALLEPETKTLVEKLRSLPVATGGAVNDRLCCRGIILMSTDDAETGFVDVIVSAGLVVVTESGGNQRRLADVGVIAHPGRPLGNHCSGCFFRGGSVKRFQVLDLGHRAFK